MHSIRSPRDSRSDTRTEEDLAVPEAEEPGELAEAVARLYQVFASRHRRAGIEFDACDQDASPQERRELARTPLRELRGGLLSTFVLNATSWTWGTPDDVWYYLPRILELVAAGELAPSDLWSLFRVTGQYWRNWPHDQQEALAGYVMALWRATLSGYWHPVVFTAIDVLAAASDLGLPVDDYLGVWETSPGESPALHLAWLIRNRTRNDDLERHLDEWLVGPAPRRVLTQALRAASAAGVAATLSAALAELGHKGGG
jgi:hypothetical protein